MAEEIPLDQRAIDFNEPYRNLELSDDDVAMFIRDVVFARESSMVSDALFERLASILPDEYKEGLKREDGSVTTAGLSVLDYEPYLNQILAESSGDGKDLVETLIGENRVRVQTEVPGIVQQISTTRMSAANGGEMPATVDGLTFEQYTQYGDAVDLLTPEQYAQRFTDTTLEELNQRFGESLTFSFSGTMAGAPLTASQGMTAGEAASYLYSLPKASIAKIQDALGRAGYFDKLGVNRGIIGDADDDATRMAWEALLFDSVQMGMSPQQTLTQKIASFQSNRAPTEPVILADPASLEQDATQFGAALLGRNLSQNELRSFVTTIHDWQRKAAQGAVMTGDNIAINLEAKAQQFFEENFLQEQLGNMSAQFSARYLE